jgi:hypothetical protein
MNKIEAYQCEFCHRVSPHPVFFEEHENICFKNPSTRSCITCLWIRNNFPVLPFDDQDPCVISQITEKCANGRTRLKTNCENWITKEIFDPDEWEEDEEDFITLLYNEPKKFLKKALVKYKKRIRMLKSSPVEPSNA